MSAIYLLLVALIVVGSLFVCHSQLNGSNGEYTNSDDVNHQCFACSLNDSCRLCNSKGEFVAHFHRKARKEGKPGNKKEMSPAERRIRLRTVLQKGLEKCPLGPHVCLNMNCHFHLSSPAYTKDREEADQRNFEILLSEVTGMSAGAALEVLCEDEIKGSRDAEMEIEREREHLKDVATVEASVARIMAEHRLEEAKSVAPPVIAAKAPDVKIRSKKESRKLKRNEVVKATVSLPTAPSELTTALPAPEVSSPTALSELNTVVASPPRTLPLNLTMAAEPLATEIASVSCDLSVSNIYPDSPQLIVSDRDIMHVYRPVVQSYEDLLQSVYIECGYCQTECYGFNNCCTVECGNCKNYFCAYCGDVSPDIDAGHRHLLVCPSNPSKSVFAPRLPDGTYDMCEVLRNHVLDMFLRSCVTPPNCASLRSLTNPLARRDRLTVLMQSFLEAVQLVWGPSTPDLIDTFFLESFLYWDYLGNEDISNLDILGWEAALRGIRPFAVSSVIGEVVTNDRNFTVDVVEESDNYLTHNDETRCVGMSSTASAKCSTDGVKEESSVDESMARWESYFNSYGLSLTDDILEGSSDEPVCDDVTLENNCSGSISSVSQESSCYSSVVSDDSWDLSSCSSSDSDSTSKEGSSPVDLPVVPPPKPPRKRGPPPKPPKPSSRSTPTPDSPGSVISSLSDSTKSSFPVTTPVVDWTTGTYELGISASELDKNSWGFAGLIGWWLSITGVNQVETIPVNDYKSDLVVYHRMTRYYQDNFLGWIRSSISDGVIFSSDKKNMKNTYHNQRTRVTKNSGRTNLTVGMYSGYVVVDYYPVLSALLLRAYVAQRTCSTQKGGNMYMLLVNRILMDLEKDKVVKQGGKDVTLWTGGSWLDHDRVNYSVLTSTILVAIQKLTFMQQQSAALMPISNMASTLKGPTK